MNRGFAAATAAWISVAAFPGCVNRSADVDGRLSGEIAELTARHRGLAGSLAHLTARIDELETRFRRPASVEVEGAGAAEGRREDEGERADARAEGRSRDDDASPEARALGQGDERTPDSFTHRVQRALKAAGFSPGPVDGKMGPITARAIEDFQRANNLPETGRADPATQRLLWKWLPEK